MGRLRSNPNIDISKLKETKIVIALRHAGFFTITNKETSESHDLQVEVKGWKKVVYGLAYDKVTYKIVAVGKMPMHRDLLRMIGEKKQRTRNRIIAVNGKRIGELGECAGARQGYHINSLPLHHSLKHWETLYYDNSSKDVQVYYKGKLFAVARLNGNYHVYILKEEYLPLCLGLILAAIDSRDGCDFLHM